MRQAISRSLDYKNDKTILGAQKKKKSRKIYNSEDNYNRVIKTLSRAMQEVP